jgi:hypothetical protein
MTDDLAKQLRTDAEAYRQSLAAPTSHDMFTLAYQWQDKKHRHVWDLCKKVEIAADRIEKLERENNDTALHLYAFASRIEKLEAALRKIKDLHDQPGPEDEQVIMVRDDMTYFIVCEALEELK